MSVQGRGSKWGRFKPQKYILLRFWQPDPKIMVQAGPEFLGEDPPASPGSEDSRGPWPVAVPSSLRLHGPVASPRLSRLLLSYKDTCLGI